MGQRAAIHRVLLEASRGSFLSIRPVRTAYEQSPWRGQRRLLRWLGEIHQGFCLHANLVALGTRSGGEVISSDSY